MNLNLNFFLSNLDGCRLVSSNPRLLCFYTERDWWTCTRHRVPAMFFFCRSQTSGFNISFLGRYTLTLLCSHRNILVNHFKKKAQTVGHKSSKSDDQNLRVNLRRNYPPWTENKIYKDFGNVFHPLNKVNVSQRLNVMDIIMYWLNITWVFFFFFFFSIYCCLYKNCQI